MSYSWVLSNITILTCKPLPRILLLVEAMLFIVITWLYYFSFLKLGKVIKNLLLFCRKDYLLKIDKITPVLWSKFRNKCSFLLFCATYTDAHLNVFISKETNKITKKYFFKCTFHNFFFLKSNCHLYMDIRFSFLFFP